MAKVKDQVLPGSDVSYIDSTGIVHYDADLVRHIMPNAYPLPTLNPTGVARETARNKRPSHQGPGTPDQEIQRRCFRACASRWNGIEYSCPEYCYSKPTTSKEKIFEAKGNQGVMCSYYDLYMSCCMARCNRSIGTISPEEECFLCPQNDPDLPNYDPDGCKQCTPHIEYTSQQMLVGESQDLTYIDDEECPDAPPCEPEDITWEIIVGGGSFNNDPDISPEPVTTTTGFSPTYYAPEDNPNCENNPTIEMTDCRGNKSIVSLAISAIDFGTAYKTTYSSGEVPDIGCRTIPILGGGEVIGNVCWYGTKYFSCDGNETWDTGDALFCACGGCDPSLGAGPLMPACSAIDGQTKDVRTDLQKEAGCCPASLL